MAEITDLTTLATTDLSASDWLVVHDLSAGTDKKIAPFAQSTWTPAIRFGGATTGITYSARTAYYVRFGAVVYVVADIRLSSKGSATGNADISGLPFTSASNPNSVIAIRWVTTTSSLVSMCGIVADGGTTFALYGATAAATSLAQLTDAAFANSTILQMSGFYFA